MFFTGILTAFFLPGFAICDYLTTKVYLNSNSLSWASVLFICASTLSANWGVQAIPNLMASELYSSEDRAIMKSFSRGVQSLLLFSSLMVSTMAIRVVDFSNRGGTKLERFLHKNQHTQRKLLNLEDWISGVLKSFQKSEF